LRRLGSEPPNTRFIVVARDRPELLQHLKDLVIEGYRVTIVLDRRLDERRQTHVLPPVERRRRDRRTASEQLALRSRGWALVPRAPR
jgi:hypothetical protein